MSGKYEVDMSKIMPTMSLFFNREAIFSKIYSHSGQRVNDVWAYFNFEIFFGQLLEISGLFFYATLHQFTPQNNFLVVYCMTTGKMGLVYHLHTAIGLLWIVGLFHWKGIVEGSTRKPQKCFTHLLLIIFSAQYPWTTKGFLASFSGKITSQQILLHQTWVVYIDESSIFVLSRLPACELCLCSHPNV